MEWTCAYHVVFDTLICLILAAILYSLVLVALMLRNLKRLSDRVDHLTDFQWWGDVVRSWFTRRKP